MRQFRCKLVKAQGSGESDAYELFIYDYISSWWGVSAEAIIEELKALEAGASVLVRFNSEGGDLFEGIAIHNALAGHKGKVVSRVDGLAASAASLVMLAGEEVEILSNAFVMIHHPWTVVWGNASDLRAEADLLDKIGDSSLVSAYVAFTGQTEAQVREWLDAETWFNATEAVDEGFANRILDPKSLGEPESEEDPAIDAATGSRAELAIDLSRYQRVPDRVAAQWGSGARARGLGRPQAIAGVEAKSADVGVPSQDMVALAAQTMRRLLHTADV